MKQHNRKPRWRLVRQDEQILKGDVLLWASTRYDLTLPLLLVNRGIGSGDSLTRQKFDLNLTPAECDPDVRYFRQL